jgi:hypothetical protein
LVANDAKWAWRLNGWRGRIGQPAVVDFRDPAGRPFLGVDEMHRYQTRYAAATATILTLRLNRQGYGVGQTGFAEKCLGLSLDRNGAHRSHAGSEVGRTREKRHLPTILAPVMTTPLVRR